jgi:hypothetical protein
VAKGARAFQQMVNVSRSFVFECSYRRVQSSPL